MRRGLGWQLAFLLAAPTLGYAAVEVQLRAGKIDVKTSGAPLAEVLDRMERTIGFKVEREGSPPNPFVPALEIRDRTPIEALLAVLEGLGLNYALSLDASGLRIEKLLLIGGATATATTPGRTLPPARPGPTFPRVEPLPQPEEMPDEAIDEPAMDMAEEVPDAPPPPGEAVPPPDAAGDKGMPPPLRQGGYPGPTPEPRH
jgi:hypothetical protein